jgi:hypothetical protein
MARAPRFARADGHTFLPAALTAMLELPHRRPTTALMVIARDRIALEYGDTSEAATWRRLHKSVLLNGDTHNTT